MSSWTSWSGEHRCAPAEVVAPASVAELADAVGRAREAGRRVRVAGAGHSFTPCVPTDGTLLDLSGMGGLLDADPATGLVRVAGGMRLAAVNAELDRLGLAFANLGDIDVQAVAGALATATHGTGLRRPTLAAQVEALEVLDATGAVRAADAASAPALFGAAKVALGTLGVTTSVTLRCVPAFTLRRDDRPEPLDEVLDGLVARAEAEEGFELFCFPYTDVALTRTTTTVDAPAAPPSARAQARERWLTNQGWEALLRIARRWPSLVPAVNRLATRLAGSSVRVDRSHRCFASPREVRFTETEWALPRDAAAAVVREVRAWIEERRYPVAFPFEVRFSAADDAFLSTAHGRETAYVAVHAYRGMPWEELFGATAAIASAHGGRPHWGKRHPLTAADLAPRYPRWDDFQAVRAALDPGGLFGNAHTDLVLGPPGATCDALASAGGGQGVAPAAGAEAKSPQAGPA